MENLTIKKDEKILNKIKEWKETLTDFEILTKTNLKNLNKNKKIAVLGGTPQQNAFAANNKKVSVLILPAKKKHSFDLQTAKKCYENKTSVGIIFSDYLSLSEYEKAKAFTELARTLKLCKKAKAKTIVLSGAKNFYELRKVSDMNSLIKILGEKNASH